MAERRVLPTPAMPNTVTARRGALMNSSADLNSIKRPGLQASPINATVSGSQAGGNFCRGLGLNCRDVATFAGVKAKKTNKFNAKDSWHRACIALVERVRRRKRGLRSISWAFMALFP